MNFDETFYVNAVRSLADLQSWQSVAYIHHNTAVVQKFLNPGNMRMIVMYSEITKQEKYS